MSAPGGHGWKQNGVPCVLFSLMHLHCHTVLLPAPESASACRAAVARFATAMFEGRCTELGLEATWLLLLYSQMIDPSLS